MSLQLSFYFVKQLNKIQKVCLKSGLPNPKFRIRPDPNSSPNFGFGSSLTKTI